MGDAADRDIDNGLEHARQFETGEEWFDEATQGEDEPTGVVVDHLILDDILYALQSADMRVCYSDVTRESECVEFTDRATGKRYEVVVRRIDHVE